MCRIRILLFNIVVTVGLFAQQPTPKPTLDSLLAQVKAAKGDARRQAMNRLKLYLRHASQASRQKAMARLRQMFHHGSRQHHSHPTPHVNRPMMQMQQMRQQTHQNGMQAAKHHPSMTIPNQKPSGGGGMGQPGGRP